MQTAALRRGGPLFEESPFILNLRPKEVPF